MSTVGDNTHRLRKKLGLTQEELAQKLGYKSKSSINKIELGINDIPISKIVKLAEVLKTTPDCIMSEVNQKEKGIEKMKETNYGLTDEQVEREIERLSASEAVALARREARLRYRRRQYLYQLRDLEKKGKALMKAGITREVLDAQYGICNEDEVIDIE